MLSVALGSGFVALVVWYSTMLRLRHQVFRGAYHRERGRDEIRSREIQQHNEAIHQNFTFFFKVTLALVGGTWFLLTRNNVPTSAVDLLVHTAGWIQVFAGLSLAGSVFFHQKSKIERWEDRFEWWEPAVWQECWMVVGMVMVSMTYGFGVVPRLLELLAGS